MADHTTTTDGLHLPAYQREDLRERHLSPQTDQVGGGNVMMWLLGALGIGGISAALFLVPGLAANALKALGVALGVVRDNPWQCAVGALLLACGWLWRGWSGEEAGRKADSALWAKAHATNLASIATLTAALNDQSAHVRALASASDARQKAARIALSRAVERGKVSEGAAVRIERAAPVVGCKTAPEILAARNEL